MGILLRLAKFAVGGAAGTAVGVAVGSVLAPERGADLQARANALLNEAQATGDSAQSETEEALRERFRVQTDDPKAFTIARDERDR